MKILKYFNALTAKSSIIFSIIFIIILIVTGLLIYQFTLKVIEKENNRLISIEHRYLIKTYKNYGFNRLINVIKLRSQNQNAAIYLLTDEYKNKLTGNLNKWPENLPNKDRYITFSISRSLGSDIITHTSRAKIHVFRDGTRLLVGRDIQPEILITKALLNLMIFMIIFISIFGFIASVLFGRYSLNKINILNREIQSITDNDLKGKIKSKNINKEYRQIALNVNRMLKRIEELIENSKNISGNIAHDLKKPLTTMKTNLESTILKIKNQEAKKYINNAINETDNLIKIFTEILNIASFETEKKYDLYKININDIIEKLFDIYMPIMEENNISFKKSLSKNCYIRGNKILLTQAFTNIIDNSIKYFPNRSKKNITILTVNNKDNILVKFIDNGDGIDKKDYSIVFDRFVRLEKNRKTNGNGLGLSLVKAILKIHDATIKLENNNPGLIFNIIFTKL
tara:strand:- start:2415 stop:3782 length:1368 start_codon:yes stop_codon:yes gene_type:complete